MGARDYNPKVGRFITQDSYTGDSLDPLSQNQYTYVSNNPLRYIDPTGHISEEEKRSYKEGRLSKAAYDLLMQYTNEYYAAKTEAGRVAAHSKAEAFRRSGYKIVSQGTGENTISAGTGGVPAKKNNDKTFYNEFKGPNSKINNGSLNANLVSWNAGLGDSMVPTKYGSVGAKGPSIQVDAGLTLDPMHPTKSGGGIYANVALASIQGQEEISLPFISETIVIKGTADFITVGGGAQINFINGKFRRFKIGGDLGIGGSIELYLK